MKKISIILTVLVSTLFGYRTVETAFACDSCGCALARSGAPARLIAGTDVAESNPWFFDFTVEQQNWDEMPAREAHLLHHQGHHVHDKTHEEFYHFGTGAHLSDDWTLRVEIPYVVRGSIEIDDHARLGEREVSEGIGDLKLTAAWRFARKESAFLGVLGGVKLPTGSTTEKNSQGVRFEPELQPGSGSTDGLVGATFGGRLGSVEAQGNAVYTFRTKGDQEFEFGDSFTSYVALGVPVGSSEADWVWRLGADLNLQIEARQKEAGHVMADSGGTTLLAGPAVSVRSRDGLEIFGNFMLPAVQDLGGKHQELDFVWHAGGKIAW